MRCWGQWVLVSLFVVLAFVVSPTRAQSLTCPSGTYDMLNWMTLDPATSAGHHMSGNANPLYTSVAAGKFYWTKGANGTPWDCLLYTSPSPRD